MSERDLEHLNECYDAYGIGTSITNGHLTDITYDNEELNEATRLIEENLRKVEQIYNDMLSKYNQK